jgi:hypothetical protein
VRTRAAANGALYTEVKATAKGGPYEAKFTRHAQHSLAPVLVESPGDGSRPAAAIGGKVVAIGKQ